MKNWNELLCINKVVLLSRCRIDKNCVKAEGVYSWQVLGKIITVRVQNVRLNLKGGQHWPGITKNLDALRHFLKERAQGRNRPESCLNFIKKNKGTTGNDAPGCQFRVTQDGSWIKILSKELVQVKCSDMTEGWGRWIRGVLEVSVVDSEISLGCNGIIAI